MFMHCTTLWRQLNLLRAPFFFFLSFFLLFESTWNKSVSILLTRNAVLRPDWTLIGGDVTTRSIIGSARFRSSHAATTRSRGSVHHPPAGRRCCQSAAQKPDKSPSFFSPGNLNKIAIVLVKFFLVKKKRKKYFLLFASFSSHCWELNIVMKCSSSWWCNNAARKSCNCPIKVHFRGFFFVFQTCKYNCH